MNEAVQQLRREWRFLAALTLVGVVVSAALALLGGPSYVSTAQVLIRQRDYSQVVFGSAGTADPVRQLATAGVLARSPGYQQAVSEAVPGSSVSDIRQRLTVSVVDGTDALQLAATGSSAAGARTLAATAATTLIATYERFVLDGLGGADGSKLAGAPITLAQSLDRARAFETSSPSMSLVSAGEQATRTDRPLSRSFLLGAIAGFVMALLILAWRARTPLAAAGSALLSLEHSRPQLSGPMPAGRVALRRLSPAPDSPARQAAQVSAPENEAALPGQEHDTTIPTNPPSGPGVAAAPPPPAVAATVEAARPVPLAGGAAPAGAGVSSPAGDGVSSPTGAVAGGRGAPPAPASPGPLADGLVASAPPAGPVTGPRWPLARDHSRVAVPDDAVSAPPPGPGQEVAAPPEARTERTAAGGAERELVSANQPAAEVTGAPGAEARAGVQGGNGAAPAPQEVVAGADQAIAAVPAQVSSARQRRTLVVRPGAVAHGPGSVAFRWQTAPEDHLAARPAAPPSLSVLRLPIRPPVGGGSVREEPSGEAGSA